MVVVIRVVPTIIGCLLIRVPPVIHARPFVRHPLCVAVLRVKLLVAPPIAILSKLSLRLLCL